MTPQVTLMAQRMQLASVTLHRPLRAGQEDRETPPNNQVALFSAPAPQGSLSLLPSSCGWQELICLSVHPSLLVSSELSAEGHNVQTLL